MKAKIQNRARAILNAIQRDAGPNRADADVAAQAAFESDMKPICDAVAGAIAAGDLAAFKGLRAMMGRLLSDANEEPALAEVLQRQIGAAVLDGLCASESERVSAGRGRP